MTQHPMYAERARRLRRLVELNAPTPVLVMSARLFLQTLEGGSWRAIWRWIRWTILLQFAQARDWAQVWFHRRVMRRSLDDALDHVFGPDEELRPE